MTPHAVSSPAKINLCLRVLGKRPDGYHELYTVFQRLRLEDRLIFTRAKSGCRVTTDHPALACDSRNLVWRAYDLLARETGFRGGVEIRLLKRIPLAAGLGGGSSNAAATLAGLNRLFRLGVRDDELRHLSRRLGADVPFFLSGAVQAIGRGRGDEITPLPPSGALPLLLVFFPQGLPTGAVYAAFRRSSKPVSLTKLSCDATMLSRFLAEKDWSGAARLLGNDLYVPACRIKPAVGRVLSFLRASSPASMMTGSGPTLFSLAPSLAEAQRLGQQVRRRFGLATWTGWAG